MNADELLKKYQILLAEHKALLEENEILKARLRIIDPPRPATSEELEEHLLLDFAAPEKTNIKLTYLEKPFYSTQWAEGGI